MASGTGRFKSRSFHFSHAPRTGKYSRLVAIPIALIAILGFFSVALLLVALVLAVAVIAIVARWFSARPPRTRSDVARFKGPTR